MSLREDFEGYQPENGSGTWNDPQYEENARQVEDAIKKIEEDPSIAQSLHNVLGREATEEELLRHVLVWQAAEERRKIEEEKKK